MRSTVLSRLRSLRSSDEHGVALVMVLIVTTIVTLLTVAGSAFALKQLKQVGRDQNWGAALAAAEAGVGHAVDEPGVGQQARGHHGIEHEHREPDDVRDQQ